MGVSGIRYFPVACMDDLRRKLLELLEPRVIAPMGACFSRSVEVYVRRLAGSPELIPVWRPSDYNANTRPRELQSTWEPLSTYLGGP
jgi:hypothetical protein